MKSKELERYMEKLFKILFLIEGYLQTCSFTFGKKIISFFLWPTIILGIIILIYRVIEYRKFYNDKKIIILLFFCLSFLASSLLQRQYGIYTNIRILGIIVLQFFILFWNDTETEIDKIEKEKLNLEKMFLLGTIILTIISFATLFMNYSKVIPSGIGPDLVFGMTWGRLFGAYWDPNIASVICSFSIIIALDYLIKSDNKYKKVMYILFIIIQMFYIAFSDSRTGLLCMLVASVMYAGTRLLNRNEKIDKKIILKASTISIFIGIVVVGSIIGIKKIYNLVLNKYQSEPYSYVENETSIEKSDVTEIENSKQIDRGYDVKEDISNRRFDIWKSGLEIFRHNIFFGVSRANIVPYARDNLPETYIVNNTHMEFWSMHNLYVDLIVSQGAIGFILFITFFIWIFVDILRNLNDIRKNVADFEKIITLIAIEFVSTLVMTEIIYLETPISFIFWIEIGYLYSCIQRNKKVRKIGNGEK